MDLEYQNEQSSKVKEKKTLVKNAMSIWVAISLEDRILLVGLWFV